MRIEVVIDDAMLDEPVRKAVAIAVNDIVRREAYSVVSKMDKQIQEAVQLYLAKRLTDEKLKVMIGTEVNVQMADRIRQLEGD